MNKIAVLIVAFVFVQIANGQNKRIDINKSFETITEVNINVISCDIEIEATTGSAVNVTGYVEWSNPKYQYEIETRVNGTKLYVEVKHPNNAKHNQLNGKLNLTMPAMTDVDVNTISGDVIVNGVGQRMVKLNSISGDLSGSEISSDVKANTISGDIELSDIKGHVNSTTISGDQQLKDISGNLKGTSVSGDFTIVNLKGNREISTVSGSVR